MWVHGFAIDLPCSIALGAVGAPYLASILSAVSVSGVIVPVTFKE